jgi:hypothetical protein
MNAGRQAEYDLAVVMKDEVVGKLDNLLFIVRGYIHANVELLIAQLYGSRQASDPIEAKLVEANIQTVPPAEPIGERSPEHRE